MQANLESAPTVVSSTLPVIVKVVRCPQCHEKMLPSALFWHQTLEHHQHVVDRAARSVLDNGEDTSGLGDVQLVSSPLLPTEGEAVVTLPDPTADKVDTTTSDKPGPVVVQPVSPVSLPTDTQENQGEDAVNHSDCTTDEAAVNSSEDVLEILPDRKMSFQYCGQWAGDILLQPTVPSNAIARFVLCNTSLFQARQEWPDVDTWLVLSLITQINEVQTNLDSLSDTLPYSIRRRAHDAIRPPPSWPARLPCHHPGMRDPSLRYCSNVFVSLALTEMDLQRELRPDRRLVVRFCGEEAAWWSSSQVVLSAQ